MWIPEHPLTGMEGETWQSGREEGCMTGGGGLMAQQKPPTAKPVKSTDPWFCAMILLAGKKILPLFQSPAWLVELQMTGSRG